MVSTLCPEGQQGSKQGCSQISRRKYAGPRSALFAVEVDFRLLHFAAYINDKQGGQNADPEHNPPGNCMRKPREQNSKQNDADAPADGPSSLNGTNSTPAKAS